MKCPGCGHQISTRQGRLQASITCPQCSRSFRLKRQGASRPQDPGGKGRNIGIVQARVAKTGAGQAGAGQTGAGQAAAGGSKGGNLPSTTRVWKGLSRDKLRVWALPAVAISVFLLLVVVGIMGGDDSPTGPGDDDVVIVDPEEGEEEPAEEETPAEEPAEEETPAEEPPTPEPEPGPSDPAETTGTRVYKKVIRSVVFVINEVSPGSYATGSGSLVDRPDRLVVTAYHVVENKSEVSVLFPVIRPDGTVIADREHYFDSGDYIRAKVVHTLKRKDLALLQLDKIPSGFVPIKLSADRVEPGEVVFTLGNPGLSLGMWVFTSGTVRQIFEQHEFQLNGGQTVVADLVETQNPARRGDSGGPLIDSQGHLSGVFSGFTEEAPFSLFIDETEVKRMLAQYRQSQ